MCDLRDVYKEIGWEEGLKEGRQEGRQEGLKEGRLSTLKNFAEALLEDNSPIQDIEQQMIRIFKATDSEVKEIFSALNK